MAKDAPIVMCVASVVIDIDGVMVITRKGDLLYADDPLVARLPQYFGPPKVRAWRSNVEQATAAPGEKRGA
jgi:hypothetical protein